MHEELVHIWVVATCRTESCAYNGHPSDVYMPDPEQPGTHKVRCAACGQLIVDVVKKT